MIIPPPIEVLPRDLSAYRAGNTGVDYVHRFASGRPGPHILINALTHGNEICGMVAATHLLDKQVRPLIGTLTISFAHVQAYEAFDADKPYDNRQLQHNLNRVWSSEWLDGTETSPELRRARELRPVVSSADHILDIHSTAHAVEPFWVYPGYARNADMAQAIGRPSVHLIMPTGMGTGTPLIQHGRHGDKHSDAGAALVVECGQHFAQSSAVLATEVALDFLAHFGLIDKRQDVAARPSQRQRRFELLETHLVKTDAFRFLRPLLGFEVFAKGETIATDGDAGTIIAPCDDCTIFMPTRLPIIGREAVYLTRPI